MNNKSLLMVFAKNPVLGTAKTRLAASVGDEKALEIYPSMRSPEIMIKKIEALIKQELI